MNQGNHYAATNNPYQSQYGNGMIPPNVPDYLGLVDFDGNILLSTIGNRSHRLFRDGY